MRWTTTAAMTAALLMSVSAPAQAQRVQIGQDLGLETYQVYTGDVITGDFTTFPEQVVGEQYLLAEELYENFLDDRFSDPPIINPDIPSPYNTSIRNLPGFYRVTLTQPALD